MRAIRDRKTVLITMAGGGFAPQSARLMELLAGRCDFECVVIRDLHDDVGARLAGARRVWELTSPGVYGSTRLDQVWRTVLSFRDAYRILRSSDADVVIAIGTALSVPLLFWSRVFRKTAIYIECISRPFELSATGRIVRALRLYDRFYAQWADQAHEFGVRYRGKLL